MTRLLSSVAALALLPLALPASAQAPAPTQANITTQLPRTAHPTHYAVIVTPDAAAMRFTGTAAITIEVTTPTRTITLNAADMTFGPVTLASATGKPLVAKTTVDPDAQTASFAFAAPIAPGTYTLTIPYAGKIYDQATGLFALDYKEGGGTKRALFTQFENSDARRFVPSWDEPFYKASFDLKAVVPKGQMAVSNLPVASRAPAPGGKEIVTFGTSPRMSTYLLFFGLGDFERATKMAGGTEVGVVTRRGDLPKAQFALDAAAAILPWYNDYFGTPFPLPKLDNIAAPGSSQFFAAMENWGAIFYFDYAMLVDPAITTQKDTQRIYTDFAHEMAHQWFGDLVTMAWWDDLWLNEGFASWMESRATQHFHPEWHPELDAVPDRDHAMERDALVTTHPVVQHVETVDQASQAFDAITYQKGEAVIGMLEGYTGATGWRDGVRAYMKRYAHQNTVTDQLWHEIEGVSGKPITQIAHDFTTQPGIPLIRVSATCAGGATKLAVDQGEFTKDRPDKTPLKWHVPVSAASPGGTPVETLVYGQGTASVPGCGPVVVNAGQSGYFRTLYTPDMAAKLAGAFATLAPIDQLGTMSDAQALGLGGLEPMANILDLVAALPDDAQPQVQTYALDAVAALDGNFAAGVPARKAALGMFMAAKFLPVLTRLGWTPKAGEAAPIANLRADLIEKLGDAGDPTVVAEARRRFDAAASDPAALPPTLRKTILNLVGKTADAATWDRLHAMAKAATSSVERTELYKILGTAKDPALADRALALAITNEPSATTSPAMISAVSVAYPDRAYAFAVANQKAVMAKVDATSSTRFIPALVANSHDPAAIAKLQGWAKANLAKEAMGSADDAVAHIRYTVQVREKRMPGVDAWLKTKGY